MNVTAAEFLRALNASTLDFRAEATEPGRVPEIVVTIGQDTVARLVCLQHAAPFVTLAESENAVLIHSSPPALRGGFTVECNNSEEVTRVSRALRGLIAREYVRIFP